MKNMKTKEEIQQLANEFTTRDHAHYFYRGRDAYIKAYTQCQEDMAKKKYTEEDVINALHSVELKNNKDYSKIYECMKEYLHSLNKQD